MNHLIDISELLKKGKQMARLVANRELDPKRIALMYQWNQQSN